MAVGINEFYKGRHIFMTGGTGFMGKTLIEKLVRSCPGIGNIYILVRNRKGKDIKSRVQELLESSVNLYINLISKHYIRKKKLLYIYLFVGKFISVI